MKRIRYIALLIVCISGASFLSGCESIDEVPPKTDTSTKAYKIPDPTPMTSQDYNDYNAIRAEYEAATK